MKLRHKKRLKEKLDKHDEKSVKDSKQSSSKPRCRACGTKMIKQTETSIVTWKCPFCGSVSTKTMFAASAEVKEANTGDSL